MVERLPQPARFERLLANLLDDSFAATRERSAHLKALRTERTHIDGAIHNMFDFIEQGVVNPHDTDFTARLSAQRTRRANLDHEIAPVERPLSATELRIMPDAIVRLGKVIRRKAGSDDPVTRQGYVRRFTDKVVVAPTTILISGQATPPEIAIGEHPNRMAPTVPSLDREWCRLQDSNL